MDIIKCALQAGGIGIWKCWFLWREENRRTRRKILEARTRTNNKLNPHVTPEPGIEPGPHWWRRVLSPLRHPCAIPAPLLPSSRQIAPGGNNDQQP